jgi:hypothetical protein
MAETSNEGGLNSKADQLGVGEADLTLVLRLKDLQTPPRKPHRENHNKVVLWSARPPRMPTNPVERCAGLLGIPMDNNGLEKLKVEEEGKVD